MGTKRLRGSGRARQATLLLVLTLALLAFSAGAALALGDNAQVLTGGNSGSGGNIRFTSPGMGNIYNADFPATGLGESAAQVRMPVGSISALKVTVKTDGTATTGNVTVTLRVNGANTILSCSVPRAGGSCNGPAGSVPLAAGARLAVRVSSTLDIGAYAFTYSFVFD